MGAVVEGEIVDVDAVSAAIKELWRSTGVRGKDVAIGVTNQKVVVRLIDLPYMERAELAGRHPVPGAGLHPDPRRGRDPRLPDHRRLHDAEPTST